MTRSEIRQALLENLRPITASLDEAEIDESTELAALGADSLDLVEAILSTIDQLGASISAPDISDVSTVGEVVTLLEQAAA